MKGCSWVHPGLLIWAPGWRARRVIWTGEGLLHEMGTVLRGGLGKSLEEARVSPGAASLSTRCRVRGKEGEGQIRPAHGGPIRNFFFFSKSSVEL